MSREKFESVESSSEESEQQQEDRVAQEKGYYDSPSHKRMRERFRTDKLNELKKFFEEESADLDADLQEQRNSYEWMKKNDQIAPGFESDYEYVMSEIQNYVKALKLKRELKNQ